MELFKGKSQWVKLKLIPSRISMRISTVGRKSLTALRTLSLCSIKTWTYASTSSLRGVLPLIYLEKIEMHAIIEVTWKKLLRELGKLSENLMNLSPSKTFNSKRTKFMKPNASSNQLAFLLDQTNNSQHLGSSWILEATDGHSVQSSRKLKVTRPSSASKIWSWERLPNTPPRSRSICNRPPLQVSIVPPLDFSILEMFFSGMRLTCLSLFRTNLPVGRCVTKG